MVANIDADPLPFFEANAGLAGELRHADGLNDRLLQMGETCASPICSSRSLGMTISVSQLSRSEVMPFPA